MEKPKKKRVPHSTGARTGKSALPSERKIQPGANPKRKKLGNPLPPPNPVPPCCGLDLSALPSGTMVVVEDGVLTAVPPPNYLAHWAFDPERPGGLPYWERA